MDATFAKVAAGLFVCSLALMASSSPASAERPARRQAQDKSSATVPPSSETKRTVYGDIIITGHQMMRGDLNNFAYVQFLGPNTTVDVPDKKSGTRLVLHADD